jgi:myosin heavy subunit
MSATTFGVDARVFVKHPKKSWVPGFVTARDGKTGKYTVTDDDHDEIAKVPEHHVTLCREDLLNEGLDPVVHDLLFLTVLHDATLLRCLRVRYMKEIIYTNIGAIVVALNPFNFKIPWYLDSQMEKYLGEDDVIRNNLPHSWAIAHNTYFELLSENRPQTILVSGESGAGKTEACKMVLKYLGQVSMGKATEEQKAFAEACRVKILAASPILEGFGNAKTVRNNNSSRFGKFIKVKFHDDGYLMGAFTVNYLLEKSRIITASPNERVYHAFYYMTKGPLADKLELAKPAEYRSTMAGKCLNVDGLDDSADYVEVQEAMTYVGIEQEDQDRLWETVAGCLVMQNVDLSPIDTDTTQVAAHSAAQLKQACAMWGIAVDECTKEMLTTTSVMRGETVVINHKLAVATDMRDALSKHMYERLFCWLIDKINASTDSGGETLRWVGVLDIFGFEDFEINSFEQICINLANETLQNHYNNYIFKRDMEECRAEGVNVDEIKCPDNSECLKLVADATGVLGLLDEECRLGTGTDTGYLEKLSQMCSANPFFERKPTMQSSFTVKHYAGNVTYQIKGLLEKNRDTLKDDFKLMMRRASNPFAAALLPAPVERVGKMPTVGGFFKSQVAELMFLINSTNPHWIRCIKPHPSKKPLTFDGVNVTNQLESSGVLGTVKIRKAGYPVRLTYAAFLARYKLLIGRCGAAEPLDVQKDAVRKAMKASQTTSQEVQLGKTRVFMKSDAYFILEKTRQEAGLKHTILLQAEARAVVSQVARRKIVWAQEATVIQAEFRGYLERSEESRTARRKAKAEMLARQKADRADFEAGCRVALVNCGGEEERAWRELAAEKERHATWIEERYIHEAEQRIAAENGESRGRQEVMHEFRNFLMSQRPMRATLHLMAIPYLEERKRRAIEKAKAKEFAFLDKMNNDHGAALFRMEVERNERRQRRLQIRIEDLEFTEMVQRQNLLPEFMSSLHRAVHPHGSMLQAIHAHAQTVLRRVVARRAVRDANEEVVLFSARHVSDTAKLGREMTAIQVGTRTVVDTSYRRAGEKKTSVTQFSSKQPWLSVNNVPDIDQVLTSQAAGNKTKRSNKFTSRPATAPGAGGAASPHRRIASSDVKAAGVMESFRDKSDEMQFLRQRHLLALDYRALATQGKYSGPYVNETTVPDKRTFYSAQDAMQTIVQEYAEQLVRELRRLNSFCVSRRIPEQNKITGAWVAFAPVDKAMLATYPPFNDWKALVDESARLQYAARNYNAELLKIIKACVHRGARLPLELAVSEEEAETVDRVHQAYFHLRGHFETCSQCLFPMASRAALIQLRVVWPHVQDPHFADRCKDCNTSFFSRGLSAMGTGAMGGTMGMGGMPSLTFN